MLNKQTMDVAITVVKAPIAKGNYSGTVKVELGTPGSPDYSVSTLKDVFFQGLAKFRLNSDKWPDYEIGKRYVSANNSQDAKANPFRIVWSYDANGKNKFSLNLVQCKEEKIDYKPDLATGKMVPVRTWQYHKKEDYVRFLYPSEEAIQKKNELEAVA